MQKLPVPPDEELARVYANDAAQSTATLAAHYGVSAETVRRWLVAADIARRPTASIGRVISAETRSKIREHHRQRWHWPTKEAMVNAYHRDGFSMRELGDALGVTAACISQRFKKLGIAIKPPTADGRFLLDSESAKRIHLPKRFPRGQSAYRNLVFEIERRPKICTHCGSARNIHVHHKDEDRRNNASDNLQVLCKSCHFAHHRLHSPLDWRQRATQ